MNTSGFVCSYHSMRWSAASPIMYVSLWDADVKAITAWFWIPYVRYGGLECLAFCYLLVFAFKTQLPLTCSGRWEFLCFIHVPNVPNQTWIHEAWIHVGCWVKKGLEELHGVGKLCPEEDENLVFQSGTELPVLQTHPFKSAWQIAQSRSNLLWELQLFTKSGVDQLVLFVVSPSLYCSIWGWGPLDLNKIRSSEKPKAFPRLSCGQLLPFHSQP